MRARRSHSACLVADRRLASRRCRALMGEWPTVRGRGFRGFRGFTIIELLVVIAVIIILLGILIVTVRAATLASQRASTATLMTSIEKALVQFKTELGYLPPVLGPRDPSDTTTGAVTPPSLYRRLALFDPEPLSASDYREQAQRWYSITSLAEYLIGYGSDPQDGADGAGLRHPGDDGAWRASQNGDTGDGPGTLADRNPISVGKVFGPYLELPDQRLLGSVDGSDNPTTGEPNVFFPGDAAYNEDDPKVIVDYWGEPIRYYRQMYRPGALSQPFRSFDPVTGEPKQPPTLADIIALRPWEMPPGAGTNGIRDDSTTVPGGDATTLQTLQAAPFALFSPGPDRRFNPMIRRDPEQRNEDNLVEVAK